jgi:hypothetical protein
VQELQSLYIDLLRKALLGQLFEDPPSLAFGHWTDLLRRRPAFDPKTRETGRDWPSLAHSMIGARRMENVQRCVEDVIASGVPGDFIETGVWRGGTTIFMRGLLKAHEVRDRTVWVADSFAGLPPPDGKRYPADRFWNLHWFRSLAVSEEAVRENFSKYGLLDDQVRFLKGWFRDTLPTAPIERLAVLRMDGDLYESTMDALTHLYPKLSVGGYAIVDDYNVPPCRKAVADYRSAHGISEDIVDIDGFGMYWRRGVTSAEQPARLKEA